MLVMLSETQAVDIESIAALQEVNYTDGKVQTRVLLKSIPAGSYGVYIHKPVVEVLDIIRVAEKEAMAREKGQIW